ncbi:MAG: biotin--[acetyl-CoA-carboxylase] ligase [Chloroflexota bacterium]|nr:biotin--[acetyl-CoA-carboxylase] ligase [Chloroflexota bacterium]
MTAAQFLSRRERFDSVGSTNDIAHAWLEAGTPEVCLAVADEQTAGRGREGRTWTAPPGAALLLSLGFRPTWLEPELTWRLAAITALAMADAGEEVAGLAAGSIRLKWPNDLVVETSTVRKLGGLLGETVGLGTVDPRAIVGIGVNADWQRVDFPPTLAEAMTSLREVADGRPIDPGVLLEAFLARLEARTIELRASRFDADGWMARQVTTGRRVRLQAPGGASSDVRALGVDPDGGGLIVDDSAAVGGRRTVVTGEIVHLRLVDRSADDQAPVIASCRV